MGMHSGMGWGGGGPLHSVWEQRKSLQYLKSGGRPSKETVQRLWKVLKPHRRLLALAMTLTTLGVVLALVPPLIIRAIIDNAIAHHHPTLLMWLAAALLLFPAVKALVSVAQNYLNTVVSQSVIHDLRTALYEHGQHLGIDFFTHTPSGEIHSRLINDLNAVQQVLSRTLTGLFVNGLTVLLTLSMMFFLNWRLALVSAIILPVFALPVVSYGQKTYTAITTAQNRLAELTAHLEETLSLSGIVVVKSFGTRAREAQHFRSLSEKVKQAQVQQNLVGQWLSFVVQALSAVGPALLYGYGGYLVIAGQTQLGTIVAFATYLTQLFNPASSLAGSNTTLIGGLALFDRIFQFLDLPISVPEPLTSAPAPGPTPSSPIRIHFEHVSFSYPKGEEVLHDITFTARGGHLTALVGPSGAGKTTLLSLAARFYDPTAGQVLLENTPLTHFNEDTLRQTIAVVTQDLFLFHTTLEQNIRYGQPTASESELMEAVQAAQLEDLVAQLPQGLQTVVGERGYRLSGGEKQRVAIARAILQNPRVLLLDEATSSLDSHAERLIQDALARLFHGRTVIAIAHRLSTILAADQIIVVQSGQIVDQGRHLELLARNGLYAHLYHEQFDAADVSTVTAPEHSINGIIPPVMLPHNP
ncbi:MAG: multidrug ABC transporter ATP-binding protein [Sulfobacillus thermosulfidooxidans]|nr:MAG: multidrug ABC transporter ATP-binding protein [Sulfobacillus thermosulfidooxidans]